VKNTLSSVKKKFISRYKFEEDNSNETKSTNINVLLNRVKLGQKKESKKKILFTVATSLGVVLFGILIF
tara:strand:+ start:1400 stop:1606 length:207 start_codon:yes stop_codon:yes gene_type:complete